MTELTTIRVEKPVVDWLNSIKGLLEWKHGRKYSLNKALVILLAEYDMHYAISEKLISSLSTKRKEEYIKKRLKQFWGDSNPPDIRLGKKDEFFKIKI